MLYVGEGGGGGRSQAGVTYGSELQRCVGVWVRKQRLHNILAIIKRARHCEVMDVFVEYCRHLRFLDRTYPPLRVQDEYRYVLLSSQSVDGSGAGISVRRVSERM